MRYSKKMQILRGVTAVRITLNFTQLRLAQYLGVSKSLISMVENGKRSLTLAALRKLAALESSVGAVTAAGQKSPAREIISHELTEFERTRLLKKNSNKRYLKLLDYRLQRMKERHAEINASLQLLQGLMQLPAADIDAQAAASLKIQHHDLCKKLTHCHSSAITKLEAKRTMMEIMTRRAELNSEDPHSYPLQSVTTGSVPGSATMLMMKIKATA